MDMSQLTPAQKQQVFAQVKAQADAQVLQQLAETMIKKCFKTCVYTPGKELSKREQQCVAKCMDRFQDTMGVVNKSLSERS